MKKLIISIIGVLILSGTLIACGEIVNDGGNDVASNDQEEEIVVMDATVIENDGSLLVTPVEGSPELRSSDLISVHISDDVSHYQEGDLVRITYDGRIAESYPAQIWASKVELIQ